MKPTKGEKSLMPSSPRALAAKFAGPALFLLACSLTRPLMLLTLPKSQPFRATLVLFEPATISALAMVLILFDYRRLSRALSRGVLLKASMSIVLAVAVVQVVTLKNHGFEEFAVSLMWISIPTLALLRADAFKKLIPFWLTLLWLINAVHLVMQINLGAIPAGLPGNRNWTANFVVVSTPFAVICWGWLLSSLRTPRKVERVLKWAPAGLALFFLVQGESRGAWLALFCAGGLFLFFTLNLKWKKVALGAAGAAALVAVCLFMWRGTDWAAEAIAEDVRLSLWRSTLDLISDKPLLGTGMCRFESDFAPYRSVDYFLCKHAAVRTNHPHNHFLFFCASFGFPAFVAWFLLSVFPIVDRLLKISAERDAVFKACCFAYVVIMAHAFFDLILYEWPTNFIGLIILGLLWDRAWPPPAKAENLDGEFDSRAAALSGRRAAPALTRGTEAVVFAVALAVLLLTLSLVRDTFLATKRLRTAMFYTEVAKNHDKAAWLFRRSIEADKRPLSIYRAAVRSYTRLRNPALAIKYFKMLLEETPVDNFAHNQGFMGVCLLAEKRFGESLDHLRAETMNFPLLTGAWFNLRQAQIRLGLRDQAQKSLDNVKVTLKLKKLDESRLMLLLRNPEYDMHPEKIPEELLRPDSSSGSSSR